MKRKVIHRIDITNGNHPSVVIKDLPYGAIPRYVGAQEARPGVISCWVEVDPDVTREECFVFTLFQTGTSIPADEQWKYLGSVVIGDLHIYHVYWRK